MSVDVIFPRMEEFNDTPCQTPAQLQFVTKPKGIGGKVQLLLTYHYFFLDWKLSLSNSVIVLGLSIVVSMETSKRQYFRSISSFVDISMWSKIENFSAIVIKLYVINSLKSAYFGPGPENVGRPVSIELYRWSAYISCWPLHYTWRFGIYL